MDVLDGSALAELLIGGVTHADLPPLRLRSLRCRRRGSRISC